MITLTSKQTQIRMIFISLLLGLILALWPKPSFSQNVASQEQAGSVLAIDKVMVQDGTVKGEIRNNSKNTVRDVQLFIRYTWLWANEFHPGKDNPSEAFYQTVSGDIAPGGSMPFKFTPERRRCPSVRVANSRSRRFLSRASRKLFNRVGKRAQRVASDDQFKAEEVRLSLMKMQKDYLIDLEDAVVAVKDQKGKVRLHQAVERNGNRGS